MLRSLKSVEAMPEDQARAVFAAESAVVKGADVAGEETPLSGMTRDPSI